MTEDLEQLRAENRRLDELLESGARDRLMSIPGVLHVATGVKQVAGHVTGQLGIIVYVSEKRPPANVPPNELVPSQIEGVPTDVDTVPKITFADDQAQYRPVLGGIQITNGIKNLDVATATVEMYGGTLGCLATRISDGKIVLLTNWHVLSRFGGRVGDTVFQPLPAPEPDDITGTFPKRPKSSENAIAKTAKMQVDSQVDCAIATVNTCRSLCCNCGTGFKNEIRTLAVNGHDTIVGRGPATNGQTVFKVGMKTGRSQGVVITTNYPPFTISRDGTTYTFSGQIQIGNVGGVNFGESGDSGSVVIGSDGKIVGLYFASPSPNHFGLANHIANVEAAMGITVNVTPANQGGFSSSAIESPVNEEGLLELLSARLTRTELGREIYAGLERHTDEVLALVNHCRPVTVAWHRNQGPRWLASAVRSSRVVSYRMPAEIEGVTLKQLLLAMASALENAGSDELRRDLALYQPMVEGWANPVDKLEELLEQLEGAQSTAS